MRITIVPLVLMITGSLFAGCCKDDDTDPVTPPATNYQDSIKNGLWAAYNFDNGSFSDESGNNRTMRGVNGIQFGLDKNGAANNALSFDGINDYSVIDAGNTMPEGNFTVSLWMMAQKTSSGRIFVKGNFNDAKGVATTFGFDDDNQTNKLLFTINKETDVCNTSPSNSSLVFLNSNTVITQNVWYAVAVSMVNGVERIYINGQLIAATPTPVSTFRNCSNAPFYFGIWWLQDLRAYMGRLDNIRIYNRALSENEVKYLSDNYK